MFHFTAFGATQTRVPPGGFTALTLFGGAEIRLPTLAERIVHRRRQRTVEPSRWDRWLGRDQGIVVTLFGGTGLIAPTLVEEYAALRNLVQSGVVPRDECRALLEDLMGSSAGSQEISRWTLFGGSSLESPSAKTETKSLQAAEQAGVITPEIRRDLAQAIGCPMHTAAEIVSRAALV
ncbi:MAG: hypothetical protein KDC87_10005 [Planctomycetes bacterium]|nr:hypothetical protein [Planctomycetota bacterium]MCB9868246.1 hypothetical protein [Planctomycetota bacterium]MCB9888778.1 hypothetical protein [Planctomycetota bacterium]